MKRLTDGIQQRIFCLGPMFETSVCSIQRMSFVQLLNRALQQQNILQSMCASVPQPTLDIFFPATQQLGTKGKVLDLHPPGNNTLLQLKIFGLKIYLTRSYYCTFPFCFVFFCVSPVHQNAHNLKFAFKQPSVVLNAKCKCSTTMKHQTAVFHQLIYSFLIDMKLLLHPAKVIS